MITFTLSHIASIIHAKQLGADKIIQTVTIDSRVIGKDCLFIALKGNVFDSHNFVIQAIQNGAQAILVENVLPINISQLIVINSHIALGKLSSWVRQQVSSKIIALTGSSGKTSVKEMISCILQERGRVLATYNNYNNKIGVSLTLLRFTHKDDFAVIELGANDFGEIAWTSNLVKPDIALVNNVSIAHISGFMSLSGVSKAKGEIFTGLPIHGQAIVNNDSNNLPQWIKLLNNKKIWHFSIKKKLCVDFFVSNIVHYNWSIKFKLHSPQGNCLVYLPVPGIHNIYNALAASAAVSALGITLLEIKNGLKKIKNLPGRLFPIKLGNGKLLLDDTYNANISSIFASVKVLERMPGYKVLIIGDIAELGINQINYHCQIGNKIKKNKIDKILSIGKLSNNISNVSILGEHFINKKLLISRIMQLISSYPVITLLVKGSRSSKMEKIVHVLQEKLVC